MLDKPSLRKQLLHKRRALSAAFRQSASDRICQRLQQLLPKNATLLCYRSLPVEVDTHALMEQWQGALFVPVSTAQNKMLWRQVHADSPWQEGAFGIQEPLEGALWQAQENSIVLCPLVGFDRRGHRIGMGMGCFDRWLANDGACVQQRLGLAFACQEVNTIPHEQHDIPLQKIITEKEVISCHPY